MTTLGAACTLLSLIHISAALDATIQLIKDYQSAEDYVGNGQYTEAIAALKQLQNRVTDPDRCV